MLSVVVCACVDVGFVEVVVVVVVVAVVVVVECSHVGHRVCLIQHKELSG